MAHIESLEEPVELVFCPWCGWPVPPQDVIEDRLPQCRITEFTCRNRECRSATTIRTPSF